MPTPPYHMQIPPKTYKYTWEHGGIQMCGGVQMLWGIQTYGDVQMYGGIAMPPMSNNPHACL